MPRSFTEREKENIKRSLREALKLIYREYDKNNFLYDSDSADFTILMNKLSEEQAKKLRNLIIWANRFFKSAVFEIQG